MSTKSDKSGRIQNTVWFSAQTKRLYYAGRCLSFPNPPKNCKKGVIVAYGVLHSTKVQCDLFCQKSKCDVLRQKKYFLMQEVTLHFLLDVSRRRARWHKGEA